MRITSLFSVDVSPTKLLRNLLTATFILLLIAFALSFVVLIIFGGGSIKDTSSIADFWGVIFGLPISAAGAFVAIVLAQRAVDISEKQKLQGEIALELSELMARTEISSIMSTKLGEASSIYNDLDKKLGVLVGALKKLHNWHYESKNYLAYFGNEFVSANRGSNEVLQQILIRCNEDESGIAQRAVEDYFNAVNTEYFKSSHTDLDVLNVNCERYANDINRFKQIIVDELIPAMKDFSETFYCLARSPLIQYTWDHHLAKSELFSGGLLPSGNVTSLPHNHKINTLNSALDTPSSVADYLTLPHKDSIDFESWILAVFFATKNEDVCLPENASLIYRVKLTDDRVLDTSTSIQSYENASTEEALEWAFNTTKPDYLLSDNVLKPHFFVAQEFSIDSQFVVQMALSFQISREILTSYIQKTFNVSEVQANICAESSYADIHKFPNLNQVVRANNYSGTESMVNGVLTNTSTEHKQLLKKALFEANQFLSKEREHEEFWKRLRAL